jgi:pimeloyl-ACP methyl ester carboxylesterase
MKIKRLLISLTVIAMTVSGCATSRYYRLGKKEFEDFDYGFKTHAVQVRNIKVSVIDEGSSDKVLVLIHGLGSNAKGWSKNIPVLSQKYRVIAVDLPGYGKSDKGFYAYSLPFYAQVLTEMLDELKIEKATFAGHSMGGQIAMITSLLYPERVDKLVLVSPAGFEKFTQGESDWMRKAMPPEFVHDTSIRNIDANLKNNFYKMPVDAEFMITERIQMRGAKDFDNYCYAVSKNVAAMLDYPMWDKLTRIKHETLILFAEKDNLIPNAFLHGGSTEAIANIGASQIPKNKLVMIPECGHFAMFEKPKVVNPAIIDFLAAN